ncbi:MarR family transcriptional regulator [Enterococcus hirae]
MNYRETMSRLNSALNSIDSAYAIIAKNHELTFNSLMVVCLISETKNITQKQICDTLHLPKYTVHSILLDFMKREYVLLVVGGNKKEKFVTFTEKGNQYFGAILNETYLFEDKILSKLGDDTCTYLVETAEKLGDIIQDEVETMNNKEV